MANELEEVVPEHLKLLIGELDAKNITGVKLIRRGNKVILLFDKDLLSETNIHIINAITTVYCNCIICINDPQNPFNYDEVYEPKPKKANKKVLPADVYFSTVQNDGSSAEYFKGFRYSGIELDISECSDKKMQFGYFLEFINPLQVQDSPQYEKAEVLDKDIMMRHEHYLKSGEPDKKYISVWIIYNGTLIEYSNGLRISEDPYLSKFLRSDINIGKSPINIFDVILKPERLLKNYEDFRLRKMRKSDPMRRVNPRTNLPQLETGFEPDI